MFYGESYNIKMLLDAGVHYGHKRSLWNPQMAEYIYGVKNGTHIIDLRQTVRLMDEALTALRQAAAQNERILFVSAKDQASDAIASSALKCGQYYVNSRWLGGMMTNWSTVSASIKTLRRYENILADKDSTFTKKEKLMIQRKFNKLNRVLGGIRNMGAIPDVIFVIGARESVNAIREATKLKKEVISIVDTNCDPRGITHVIPGNDDSRKAIELYCELASSAILMGMEDAMKKSGKAGKIDESTFVETEATESRDADLPLKRRPVVVEKLNRKQRAGDRENSA